MLLLLILTFAPLSYWEMQTGKRKSGIIVTKVVVVVILLLITCQYLANALLYRHPQFQLLVLKVFSASLVVSHDREGSNSSMALVRQMTGNSTGNATMELCPIPSWTSLKRRLTSLSPGGKSRPTGCTARTRVAIVIPYRDREIHLKIFLNNIHPFLQRQQLDYGIYIVEMAANTTFNRALLMNIGYMEALREYDYDCFIFHDVDLIPEDDRNLYTCQHSPRHMSVAIDTFDYKLPYPQLFGGVTALSREHFRLVNGFSNLYFGWGGEDDDMYRRVLLAGLTVTRYTPSVARYKMLSVRARRLVDGLSSLKYRVLERELRPLYTWILASVNATEIINDESIHKLVQPPKKLPRHNPASKQGQNIRKQQKSGPVKRKAQQKPKVVKKPVVIKQNNVQKEPTNNARQNSTQVEQHPSVLHTVPASTAPKCASHSTWQYSTQVCFTQYKAVQRPSVLTQYKAVQHQRVRFTLCEAVQHLTVSFTQCEAVQHLTVPFTQREAVQHQSVPESVLHTVRGSTAPESVLHTMRGSTASQECASHSARQYSITEKLLTSLQEGLEHEDFSRRSKNLTVPSSPQDRKVDASLGITNTCLKET
ncbi:BRE4-like protein, partial [Mya arenaria]